MHYTDTIVFIKKKKILNIFLRQLFKFGYFMVGKKKSQNFQIKIERVKKFQNQEMQKITIGGGFNLFFCIQQTLNI